MPKIPSFSSPVFWPVLAVFGSVLSLCLGTSFAKQLFPVVGAQGASALRVGLSALVLLLVWRPWRWTLSRADAWLLLRFGIALGLMNLLFYMALQTIPLGIAVAIEFTGPLAVAVYFSRRRSDLLWVGLTVTGLLLLLPLGLGGRPLNPQGVAYALGAAFFWGSYIVTGKRAGHLGGGQTVSLGIFFAALIVVPAGAVHAGAALLEPRLLLIGLVVAVVSSAIPITLEMYALKRLPRETFGIMASLEPAVAALIAMLFLREMLSPQQWLAIGCIVAASAGSVMALHLRGRQAAARQPSCAPAS